MYNQILFARILVLYFITPPESTRSSLSNYSSPNDGRGVRSTRLSSIPDPDTEQIFLDVKNVFSYARHGHAKIAERCLENGFDPNKTDEYGNTLFHIAAQNGNKRIAKAAIKYGGDMDCQNMRRWREIHDNTLTAGVLRTQGLAGLNASPFLKIWRNSRIFISSFLLIFKNGDVLVRIPPRRGRGWLSDS